MSAAGEMPERKRQAGRQEAVRQLLQALGPAALVQVEGAGLQAGAEAAADLVRGHLCHPEEMPQLNARLTTRLRGSGGPLPPFRDRFEPQKNDLGHHLTPEGVFFLPMIYFPLLNGDFVNGPTLSRGKRPALGMGSVVIYPPSPPIFLHSREWAVKGATHRRSRRLALDGLPRLCYFQRRGGGIYPPEPPPFPG